jgi:hypothetical protein
VIRLAPSITAAPRSIRLRGRSCAAHSARTARTEFQKIIRIRVRPRGNHTQVIEAESISLNISPVDQQR